MLEWDTHFFGFPVAQISQIQLNSENIKHVLAFCRVHHVRLLQFKCDAHNKISIQLAEKHGFHFTDVRMIMERKIEPEFSPLKLPGEINFRLANNRDVDQLMEIADDLYSLSRYYFDENFPKDRLGEFYQSWVKKAVLGQFDDYAWVLYDKNNILGFCTAMVKNRPIARIGLVGIKNLFAGKGYGRLLLLHFLNDLKFRNINQVEVVTQGRNIPAQRLYQKSGFLTKCTEIYYHKWFDNQ